MTGHQGEDAPGGHGAPQPGGHGAPQPGGHGAPQPGGHGAPQPGGTVSFANWPGYIDTGPECAHPHPTLAEFTRRTGISVSYSEVIGGNEQFFGRIGVPLAMGSSTGYDLVVLTDWMIAQLMGLGWAERLDPAAVPNAVRMLPALRESPLGDVLRHSLPWQAGFTGIGCNVDAAGRPVTSVLDLLTAPDLRGRVAIVSDMRDVMGLILLEQGHDPAAFTETAFDLAIEILDHAFRAGQIRTVTNDYVTGLVRGDIAACVAWAGHVLAAQREHPGVRFALPEAGGMLWTDNMMIPARARNPGLAMRLIDYYYEPRVAARVAAARLFVCPVAGAEEELRREQPGMPHLEWVFPPPEVLAKGHYFARLTQVQNAVCAEKFTSAVGL